MGVAVIQGWIVASKTIFSYSIFSRFFSHIDWCSRYLPFRVGSLLLRPSLTRPSWCVTCTLTPATCFWFAPRTTTVWVRPVRCRRWCVRAVARGPSRRWPSTRWTRSSLNWTRISSECWTLKSSALPLYRSNGRRYVRIDSLRDTT